MKNQKSKKRKFNYKKLMVIIFTIFFIFSNIYLIHGLTLYKSIETPLRILGSITIIFLSIILWLLIYKYKHYKKQKLFITFCIISLILNIGMTIVGRKLNTIYSKLNVMTTSKYEVYSTSVITNKNNSVDDIKKIKDNKVGIINDQDDYEGYTIGNKIIKDNNIANTIRYNDYNEMINDLINNKIAFAVVPTNYKSRLSDTESAENIEKQLKIIYTKEEKKEKQIKQKKTKSLNEPFTILIMGVDTVNDGFSSGFNGDALILVTFNPKTTSATMLSIPRDTYMPIACMNGKKTKITNAGWRGQDCIYNTIEDYFGITIDYHIKINFNGVVSLVDSLGGVEVDVPYSFCEQNSKRQWGKNTIFVKGGKQVLNGEQALAFSRHRKVTQYMANYCGSEYIQNGNYWNDFTRGQNQQTVIKALLSKLKEMDSFSTVEKVLDTISKNLETDISTDNILSLYNLAKDSLKNSANKNEPITIQKLYLSGRDARIFDQGSKLSLYNYIAYDESRKAVVDAMKINLGLKELKPIKTFTFSVKEEYEEPVIGKNVGGSATLSLVPNFIGRNINDARSLASANNLKLNVIEVEGSPGQFDGQILTQDISEGTDIEALGSSKTITVKVARVSNTDTTTTSNQNIEETKEEEKTDTTKENNTEKEEEKTSDKNNDKSNEKSNDNKTEEVTNKEPEEVVQEEQKKTE